MSLNLLIFEPQVGQEDLHIYQCLEMCSLILNSILLFYLMEDQRSLGDGTGNEYLKSDCLKKFLLIFHSIEVSS